MHIKLLTRSEWDVLAPLFGDLSYRQCGSYADAAAHEMGATSEFVGLFKENEIIGLANVRVKTLPFTPLGIAYVSYGPLTARGSEFSADAFYSCLNALRQRYVEDRHLMLRIVPPLRGGRWSEAQAACFQMQGFSLAADHKLHETFILDLTDPLTEIRKRFDAKWRNDLVKAEKSQIKVTKSISPNDFDSFEVLFHDLIKKKGFAAPHDVAFFKRVQQNSGQNQQIVAHLAWHQDELVAGHIGSFVGDTAVYLLGAANAKGREIRASYLLQWAVIEYAKSVGNRFYDLGGIDPKKNPDVYRFKKRLNGRRAAEMGPYELAPARLTRHILRLLEATYKLYATIGSRAP